MEGGAEGVATKVMLWPGGVRDGGTPGRVVVGGGSENVARLHFTNIAHCLWPWTSVVFCTMKCCSNFQNMLNKYWSCFVWTKQEQSMNDGPRVIYWSNILSKHGIYTLKKIYDFYCERFLVDRIARNSTYMDACASFVDRRSLQTNSETTRYREHEPKIHLIRFHTEGVFIFEIWKI